MKIVLLKRIFSVYCDGSYFFDLNKTHTHKKVEIAVGVVVVARPIDF